MLVVVQKEGNGIRLLYLFLRWENQGPLKLSECPGCLWRARKVHSFIYSFNKCFLSTYSVLGSSRYWGLVSGEQDILHSMGLLTHPRVLKVKTVIVSDTHSLFICPTCVLPRPERN